MTLNSVAGVKEGLRLVMQNLPGIIALLSFNFSRAIIEAEAVVLPFCEFVFGVEANIVTGVPSKDDSVGHGCCWVKS